MNIYFNQISQNIYIVCLMNFLIHFDQSFLNDLKLCFRRVVENKFGK